MLLYHWHIVFVLAMAYVLWHMLALRQPGSEELREVKLNYVNFGLVLTFGVLSFACLAYVYYSNDSLIPQTLLELSYVIWTVTICAVLWQSNLHKSIKIMALPMLIGTLALHYWFKTENTGISGFLRKVDSFTRFGGGDTGVGLRLSVLLKIAFFFVNAFVVINYYGKVFEIVRRSRIGSGELEEGLQEEAIKRVIVVLSIGISFIIGLVLAGTDVGRLSLFSGLVAAGISIALKDLLANMAAGMLLLWDKSIKTNDVISLDKDRFGVVRSMTVRYLVIEDRNDIRFLVPNSELITKTITNWTQKSRTIRLKLDVAVAYDSDIAKVRRIMKDVCLKVPRVLQDPPPRILILGLGDSTINVQLRFYIEDPENGVRNVLGELYELLLGRFKLADVRLPFLQREIRLLPQSSVDVKVHEDVRVE